MLTHRLQLLLDDDRYERVTAAAKERNLSVAAVIRGAIDRDLAVNPRRRAAAGAAILGAKPMPVPHDVDDLLNELDAIRGGGL